MVCRLCQDFPGSAGFARVCQSLPGSVGSVRIYQSLQNLPWSAESAMVCRVCQSLQGLPESGGSASVCHGLQSLPWSARSTRVCRVYHGLQDPRWSLVSSKVCLGLLVIGCFALTLARVMHPGSVFLLCVSSSLKCAVPYALSKISCPIAFSVFIALC